MFQHIFDAVAHDTYVVPRSRAFIDEMGITATVVTAEIPTVTNSSSLFCRTVSAVTSLTDEPESGRTGALQVVLVE